MLNDSITKLDGILGMMTISIFSSSKSELCYGLVDAALKFEKGFPCRQSLFYDFISFQFNEQR